MDIYNTYSLEELLSKIKTLETENDLLREKIERKSDVFKSTENNTSNADICLKNKYASKIIDSLPDTLAVIDKEGTLVELISSREIHYEGMERENFIGKNAFDMVLPSDLKNIKAQLDWVRLHKQPSFVAHDLLINNELHHYENRIIFLDDDYVLCICRNVTEYTRSKKELELSNQKMKMAEDIASLSHWYFYPETQILEAPGILSLLKNAVNGRTSLVIDEYLEHIHPKDRDSLRELFSGKIPNSGVVEHRVLIEGKVHYFHTRMIRHYQKNGVIALEGYAQDMTYVVEKLHELEMVKYAVNNAAEVIFFCRLDGTLEFANINFSMYQGVFENLSLYKLYELNSSISGSSQWNEKIQAIRKNGGKLKYTTDLIFSDDIKRTFEVSVYIIADHMEEEVVWFFSRDITERVERENKISKLNILMDSILNNIPVYLFVKDPADDFRYLYWNKAFEEHSHIPASKALGKTDLEIFPNIEDANRFRQDDVNLLENKERTQYLEEYITATGEKRIVSTSKALIPSENGIPLIIGVSWDLTELKSTEKELIAARIKAEQSDRLKTAFLANMSHEIRTPLNAIVGFSKLIADADSIKEKNAYSEIINHNSEMLLQLINDILDISKIEAGSLEFINLPMDLGDLCRDIYEVHKNRVSQGVSLMLDNKETHLHILGDRNRISQVITNFVTNACKFTQEGEIHIGFRVENDLLEVYVKDTGIGISQKNLATIFQRFIKLDSFAQGTGLGLAISKMIVEKMNGVLTVESQRNRGSVFRFTIPYIKDNFRKPKEEESTSSSFEQKTRKTMKKLLIAEDVDSNFLLLRAILGKQYELIRAYNGKEAISKFKECDPDLIFMDLKMPEMDGLEATRIIRSSYSKSVPIIALTAFAFDSDREKTMEAGCDDFLTKPVSMPDLHEILKKYLGE